MSEVNGQTVSQQPYLSAKLDKGDDPQPDSKMGDGQVEIATGPRSANSTRPGAPMFREQPYNSQQQGALFPVHTIVVQPTPGQPKARGNFSKAAAVAMNRRPIPPSTYFIQHRQQKSSAAATVTTTNLNEVIVDEGPTVKQHLQEQQKQLKAKERMMEQQSRQPTAPKESNHHNGASQIVTGQVIRDTRTDTPQIVKTFTVQQINSSGSIIVSNSRQLGSQQKRPPARPVPAETQPRLLAPRSRVNVNNLPPTNRKLKVIVSPGVATGFTTAAQKQQLAQAPYVVSTTPLPPTAPGPPHSSAQISVHPLPPQGLKTVTVQKKALQDHIRKQAMPMRKHPDQPSEYHVVTTVTPVTTPSAMPKPPPRRHYSPSPMVDKLGELPLAILEGEEEIIAKEQARKEEERLRKEAEMIAFEKHVQQLKEREQKYLDQIEKAKKEEELRRYEQRHQEAQKQLDEKIAKEMKLKHDRDNEQRRRRDDERRQLRAQNQQQLAQPQQRIEEQKKQDEVVMRNGEDGVQEQSSVSQSSSQELLLDEDEDEEKDDPLLSQVAEPQNHLMTEPLGEVNLDDILQVGGDFAWNYQGVEQDVFPAPVEAYPFEIPPQGYYNEVPMNHPHHYGPAMHHQQLAGYVPELAQHHQMIDPHQEVIHHASQHIGYLEPAGPIEDIFDKDTSLDKLLTDDALNLENFTDVLNDPNLMDSFPDFMDDNLCQKPIAAKKTHSPDNVMSLIDWISNDDHDIGDDGDDLMGLRDERLESTASEYLNVCADVDFDLDIAPNEGQEGRPSSSVGNAAPLVASASAPVLPGEPVSEPAAVSSAQSMRTVVIEQGLTESAESNPQNLDPGAGRARRKGRSPQIQAKPEEIVPVRINRRRNEDRHTRQRKAEMDALEKEREAKQIAADCERVRQIMEMEAKAIQAEKEAEALNKGPPPKKKSRSQNNRARGGSVQRQDASPTKSSSVSTPTSGATPLARTPDPVTAQPVIGIEFEQSAMPIQTLVPTGPFEEVPLRATWAQLHRQPQPVLQGCTTTTSITGPIIATRTNVSLPPPVQTYQQNQPQGPVPYADPSQYLQHHQQNYNPPHPIPPQAQDYIPPQQHPEAQYPTDKPEQQFVVDAEYEQRLQNQYPTVDYGMGYQQQAPMTYPPQEYAPQQWYGAPVEQYYQPEAIQPDVYPVDMPSRPERTLSMDAGMVHEEESSEAAKKKNRRSNSFTNGMDVDSIESEHPHPAYQYDEYGNVVAVQTPTKEDLDNAIVNYLTENGSTVNVDKDLEALILSGNAETLEKVLQTKENAEVVESYNTVPIDILFSMMDNPQAFFSPEELTVLSDVHGIDTTEQLKVEDTNIGIEVPRDLLEAQDYELLEDYEWKRILLQSFLHFVDEEKEEELAYMEDQCYAAHIEAEQRFATKMEVLKKGLTSFLYNNTAMLDEITRLAGKLMVTSEERKVLARRLCHHQRNYIRRLQTASKRRSDAEKRRRENGIIESPEKIFTVDANGKKSHKKKMPPTPPAVVAARKSTVDRLVEEIMKTSKKRGRPFSKDLQKSVSLPSQPTTTPPVVAPAAKKKERTASVSSAAGKTLAPPPISAKRHSAPDGGNTPAAKERSRERPSRRESQKREPQKKEPAAQKKEAPEIIVTPPKVEEPKPKEETKEEKEKEKEKEEARPRRQRDRKQPVVKYEEPKFEEEEEVKTRSRRRERKEDTEQKPKRRRERRMKGYVYEEEPLQQPEPEPEPEVTDPDAPIGLRKSARRSAQHLNFIDFSPRNTPDPDDRKRRPGRPRVESSSSPSVERRRSSKRGRQNDSISEDSKEVDSSPNTTTSGPEGISPNTSLGENDNTTTSPDTPASDPPKEEDKESHGRRSLRARRPTQKQEESKDYEDDTPKKRRRVRTESSSTTASTSSNPPVEKPSTRQSTRRRS